MGIPCGGHRARQMRWEEYKEFDYLIGMDSWNIRNINRIIGNGDPEGKVYLLLDLQTGQGRILQIRGIQEISTLLTGM